MRSDQFIRQSLRTMSGVFANDTNHFMQIDAMVQTIETCFRAGGKLLICGNGGSAADAQHIAAEFVGRFAAANREPLPAIALTTDSSILTALGNDFGYDTIFSRQVIALGRPGDVLWVISTSGNSQNVIRAIQAADALGMRVIMFCSAGQPNRMLTYSSNPPRPHFAPPISGPATIQQLHMLAAHAICADLDERFKARPRE